MNVRRFASALVASKLRIGGIIVLIVVVSIGGAFAAGLIGVPGLVEMNNTFGEVTDETTAIETELVVSNPNPVGIGLGDVSVNYTVSMNDVEMAHGGRDGFAVGSGNSSIDLETEMQNEAIPPWWVTHIENDERTVIGIDATITSDRLGRGTDLTRTHEIETDLISAFNSEETRPVNADSPLTDDPVLYINETRGEWGTVSDEETPIEMAFTVYNPNLEPYVITELGYDITMNEVAVGSGETHEGHVIQSHSEETIGLTTVLDNQRLDDWWVTHLDGDVHGHQVSDLRIEFYAIVELPTGEITVSLDELTYEESIETDIFDEGLPEDRTTESEETNEDGDDSNDTERTEGEETGDSTEADGDGTEESEETDGSDGEEDDGTEEDDESAGDGEDDDDELLPV